MHYTVQRNIRAASQFCQGRRKSLLQTPKASDRSEELPPFPDRLNGSRRASDSPTAFLPFIVLSATSSPARRAITNSLRERARLSVIRSRLVNASMPPLLNHAQPSIKRREHQP